jgi:DNA mismatch endonuclease (patch repair protein)
MASIKGRNTSPERVVKACLRQLHYRYRSNVKTLEGTPDIVLVGRKKLIFIHGCFWHGHKGCPRASRPETNREFWNRKIEGNIKRDARILRQLKKNDWRVLVIWQCQTKNIARLENRLKRFIER